MPDTLVIQSHRSPVPHEWIHRCLRSVRSWAQARGYDYRFTGDEIFQALPGSVRNKTASQTVIASDLARLYSLRQALQSGYDTVVWLDADFYIFNPDSFKLIESDHAIGRETWVQSNDKGRFRVYRKVHNALLMFRRGNPLLEFYLSTAQRLVLDNNGAMAPQYIGPKLLTALHNICRFAVMHNAEMLSPPVLYDIAAGGGAALDCFIAHAADQVAGANLCGSLYAEKNNEGPEMETVMDQLDQGIL